MSNSPPYPNQQNLPAGAIPVYVAFNNPSGVPVPVTAANPLPTSGGGGGGGGNTPYQNIVPMTVGTTYTAGTALQIDCTVAGTVTMAMGGTGGNTTVHVYPGLTILPYAVTEIVSATATATYTSLS